jgi:hypothetical protein
MQIRPSVSALLMTLALSAPASAQFQARNPNPAPGENYNVEVGVMFWTPTPGIVIGSSALTAINITGLDFVQEFGIQKARFAELRGVVRGGKHKLRVSKVPISYQETTQLQRPIALGGTIFNVRANATADLQWDLWRIGYEYDVHQGQSGYVGFITEVKYNHVVANLRATDATGSAASLTDATVPVPQLGLVGRGYPHKNVSITAEFTGFKVPGFLRNRLSDAKTLQVNFKDFEVYGNVSISRYVGVQGGYRSLATDYVVDDDTGDLTTKGPYFGAVVRF